MKKFQKMKMIGLILILIFFSSNCVTETKYRMETVPEKVTKYRTEDVPVQKLVDVPYEEEVQVPKYRMVEQSKLNPENNFKKIAFIPFLDSTTPGGNIEIPKKIENQIKKHQDFNGKYRIVYSERIKETIRKDNLLVIKPEDIRKLNKELGVDLIITGNIKSFSDLNTIFKIEAIDTNRMISILKQTLKGTWNQVLNRIETLFFGKSVRDGFTTKTVTKYKKEYKIVYEKQEVPYETTEYVQKQVPYKKVKKLPPHLIVGFGGIIILVLTFVFG